MGKFMRKLLQGIFTFSGKQLSKQPRNQLSCGYITGVCH